MMEKSCGMKPRLCASCSSCLPKNPVPSVVAAVVTDTNSPGLLRCRICAAPTSLAIAVLFSYSGSSRSKSMALSPYLLITCWYAAAVDCGSPQVWPSLVPPYPPAETDTSPPAPRTVLMSEATAPSEPNGVVPSHVGLHPPPLGARMNASSNAFCPVAAITWLRSGGLLSRGMTYGAEPYQLVPNAANAGPPVPTANAVPAAARVRAARMADRGRMYSS